MPEASSQPAQTPSSDLPATWKNVSRLLDTPDFTARALPALLRDARWFGGKAHPLREVRVAGSLPVGEPNAGRLLLLDAIYADRSPESYILPVQLAREAPPNALVIARLDGGVLFDALHDAQFRDALFALIFHGKNTRSADGEIAGICGSALSAVAGKVALPLESRALTVISLAERIAAMIAASPRLSAAQASPPPPTSGILCPPIESAIAAFGWSLRDRRK